MAFKYEIDAWLNPDLFRVERHGPPLSFDTLVERLEQSDPALQVDYLTFDGISGNSAMAFVSSRAAGGSGVRPSLGYNQAFIDPSTGELLGTRQRGACCLQRQNVVSFLLLVHDSLFIPGKWGYWLMGIIAIFWLFDCFIGLYLTLPRTGPLLRKWKPSWLIKRAARGFRLHLDLHRATGLWLWTALLLLALSSVYLNLRDEVFKPVVSQFSPLTPRPSSTVHPLPSPNSAKLTFESVRTLADAESRKRGWDLRVSGVTYLRARGIFLAFLWPSHYDRGNGLGTPTLVYDAHTGKLLRAEVPGNDTPGDTFSQLQFPLHSGQIGGLAGRIVVCLLGLAVALLSITGAVIWWKKLRARSLVMLPSRLRRNDLSAD